MNQALVWPPRNGRKFRVRPWPNLRPHRNHAREINSARSYDAAGREGIREPRSREFYRAGAFMGQVRGSLRQAGAKYTHLPTIVIRQTYAAEIPMQAPGSRGGCLPGAGPTRKRSSGQMSMGRKLPLILIDLAHTCGGVVRASRLCLKVGHMNKRSRQSCDSRDLSNSLISL